MRVCGGGGRGILIGDTCIWASSKGKNGFVKDAKHLLSVFRVIKDTLNVVKYNTFDWSCIDS